MSIEPYTFYMAGDMFDHKHLAGNALLGKAIYKHSNGKYQAILPQALEMPSNRGVDVRNTDLQAVMACDFGVFNFDGPDLDSGTVVEFMFAKMLDVPAVLLRTDFRDKGDGDALGWNLMATYYPRSEVVKLHALAIYREQDTKHETVDETLDAYFEILAKEVIAGLDRALATPPLLTADQFAEQMYNWALTFPANGFMEHCGPDFVAEVIARKKAKGLLG